ncbi:unnamed protein product [Rotaria sp. Silwood1]|nr:unnamed protein product [Rotaria sp. Silwood1]
MKDSCNETSFDVHIQSVSQPLGNLQIGNIYVTLAHIILEIPLDEIDKIIEPIIVKNPFDVLNALREFKVIGITRSTCDLQWLSIHNDDETSNQSYIIEGQTEKR